MPARANRERVDRILQELRSGNTELSEEIKPIFLDYFKANRNPSESTQHLQELRERDYEGDSRPELSKSFDAGIVQLFGKRQVDLSRPVDPLSRVLAEKAVSAGAELQNLLKMAYLQVQSKYGDNDESFQGRALVGAIKRGAFSASSGVKALVGKLLSDLENKPDEDVTEWVYTRFLDPNTVPDSSRPSTAEPMVDTDRAPNPVTRRSLQPGSPYSPPIATPRDHSPIGLSEAQQLYGQLGATANGLDAISLRLLVHQAKTLRGEK